MKDWKTTLIAVAGAMLICIAQALLTGTVDIKTLITAVTIAGIGAFSSDAKVDAAIAGSPFAKQLLPFADAAITQLDKTDPSPIFDKIHQVLTNIEANTAAVAAVPLPAPAAAVQNIIQEQPAQAPTPTPKPVPVAVPVDDAAPGSELT